MQTRSTARLAGALYLAIIVLGVWAEGFARGSLVVPSDDEGLFRLSLAADVGMAVCDVGLAILLYRLLRPAGEVLVQAATAFRLVQTSIIGASLLALTAALSLPDELARLAVEAHGVGYDLGLVFFGVSSLLVGTLLWRSSHPALGLGMGAAGATYLTGSGLVLLAPHLSEGFAPAYLVPLLAESALCLGLLSGRVTGEQRIGWLTARVLG